VVQLANWVGSHVLALITKKGNQNIALITYEISTDGQTLTVRISGLLRLRERSRAESGQAEGDQETEGAIPRMETICPFAT
jgi:hypothetical protein